MAKLQLQVAHTYRSKPSAEDNRELDLGSYSRIKISRRGIGHWAQSFGMLSSPAQGFRACFADYSL